MSEERVAELERELAGTQEMLGFILLTVGEPVVVPKATLTEGIPAGAVIKIDENIEDESFVFSVEIEDEQ